MDDASSFDVLAFEARRRTAGTLLGSPLVAVRETGSTNDDAFQAARTGAPHGAAFLADVQSRGRGRRGHTWTSPPGENLTVSVVLRSEIPADRVSVLSLVTGLAVRAVASRRVSATVTVKWPNDVLVGRKKLAGILVESRLSGAAVDAIVVGVGLNVAMRALPPDLAPIATSLALLGDPAPSREAVLAEFLEQLETRLERFVSGQTSVLVEELRGVDALLGEAVAVGDVRGIGAGIDQDGALLVRDDAGRVHRVTSGTVERLTPRP